MVILAQVFSYLLPAGSFERVENAAGRLQVAPGSFHFTPGRSGVVAHGQPDGHSQRFQRSTMFFVQSLANFLIPSGSGQAYVTMPIMAPLADLVGVSRQVAVLAYQFGDGFSNILVPTQAVIVGALAMAGIPYDRWVRFILPFMVKIWILGSIALAVAVWIGYA